MVEEEIIGGRYKLGSRLGAGGMGTVYEATDLVTRLTVAVKLVRSELLGPASHASRRFEREARAVRALAVPNIVRLLDSGFDAERETPFFVMERLHGRDLKQLFSDLKCLAPALVVRLAAHAAVGLRAAHAAGIVHRDVKPANLFLDSSAGADTNEVAGAAVTGCVLKVLDFGVSKFDKAALAYDNTSVSIDGSMIGSPAYMSPEQARGESDLDARTDVWSLGVVMYEALTGHLPFGEGLPLGQIILSICSEPVRPVWAWAPWVCPRLSSVVHRAMAKSRDERWQSAEELLQALYEIDPACADAISWDAVVPVSDGETRTALEVAAASPAPSPTELDRLARQTATDSGGGRPLMARASDRAGVVTGNESSRHATRRWWMSGSVALAGGAFLLLSAVALRSPKRLLREKEVAQAVAYPRSVETDVRRSVLPPPSVPSASPAARLEASVAEHDTRTGVRSGSAQDAGDAHVERTVSGASARREPHKRTPAVPVVVSEEVYAP